LLLDVPTLDKTWSQNKTTYSKAALAMQCQLQRHSKRAQMVIQQLLKLRTLQSHASSGRV